MKYGKKYYGEEHYGEVDSSNITNYCNIDIMPYLPSVYQQRNWIKLSHVLNEQLCRDRHYSKELGLQRSTDFATWGIDIWEEELGINNSHLPLDQRRSIIKAKLRGRGTTTVKVLKNVIESFSDGIVEIEEHFEDFYFTVKFIGEKGIPKNLEIIQNELEIIVPAHLTWKFEFTLITHGMLKYDLKMKHGEPKREGVTYAEMKHYRLDEINTQGGK